MTFKLKFEKHLTVQSLKFGSLRLIAFNSVSLILTLTFLTMEKKLFSRQITALLLSTVVLSFLTVKLKTNLTYGR